MLHTPVKLALLATFCLAYLAAEGAAWMTLVPETMSRSTYLLTSMVGLILMSVAIWSTAEAAPTRSIAHVLYDAEHPDSERSR